MQNLLQSLILEHKKLIAEGNPAPLHEWRDKSKIQGENRRKFD